MALTVLSLAAALILSTASPALAADPPPTPTVSISGPITEANQTQVTVSGTSVAGGHVLVGIMDDNPDTSTYYTWVTATPGFSVTYDATELWDGTITGTARLTDGDGNISATATATTTKSTPPPAPTVEVSADPIDASNETAVTVSGTGAPGSAAIVRFRDSKGGYFQSGVYLVDDAYSITLDVSHMAAGPMAVSVQLNRKGGLSPETVVTVQKTSSPPSTNPLAPVLDSVTATVNGLVCTLQGLLGSPCLAAAKAGLRG